MASMHYSKFEDCCDWRAPFFVVVLAFTFVFVVVLIVEFVTDLRLEEYGTPNGLKVADSKYHIKQLDKRIAATYRMYYAQSLASGVLVS